MGARGDSRHSFQSHGHGDSYPHSYTHVHALACTHRVAYAVGVRLNDVTTRQGVAIAGPDRRWVTA